MKVSEKGKSKVKKIIGKFKPDEKYQIIFRRSPAAICLMRPDGIITDMNRRIYDFLQYEPEEVIGKHFWELPFITPEGIKKLSETLPKRLAGGEIPSYEIEFVSKSGGRHFGLLDITLLKDKQGNPLELIAMLTDVTALKQSEEKLRKLNKELDDTNLELQRAYDWMRRKRDQLRTQLFEEDFVFLLDHDGRIQGLSEKVFESLGVRRSRLVGARLADFLTDDSLEPFRKELALAEKGIADAITVGLSVGEDKKYYTVRMVRFSMDNKRLVLVVLRSV